MYVRTRFETQSHMGDEIRMRTHIQRPNIVMHPALVVNDCIVLLVGPSNRISTMAISIDDDDHTPNHIDHIDAIHQIHHIHPHTHPLPTTTTVPATAWTGRTHCLRPRRPPPPPPRQPPRSTPIDPSTRLLQREGGGDRAWAAGAGPHRSTAALPLQRCVHGHQIHGQCETKYPFRSIDR